MKSVVKSDLIPAMTNNRYLEIFYHYFNQLKKIAISSFKWSGLPDSISERFLELTLFDYGQCLFFNDDIMGFLTLPFTIAGQLNVYNLPKEMLAYSNTGYTARRTEYDSVIVFNDNLFQNGYNAIYLFAVKLTNIDMTLDINVNAQKTPILILTPEGQRLSMQNLYNQYIGNMPVLFGYQNMLDDSAFKVLKTDAPYLADKLIELKNAVWNEALTYLGVSNVAYQKKERMVSDEVIRGMGGVIANRNVRLFARREACEKINNMFGLNLTVEFQYDSTLISANSEGGRKK